MLMVIALFVAGFAGLVFLFVIFFLLLRGGFAVFGSISYQAYKYFTYTLPHTRNGRLQRRKREEEETAALEKAASDMKKKDRRERDIRSMVDAVIKRAIYLQNKFPNASDSLIDKFIVSFPTKTMAQLEEIEKEIRSDHERNSLFNLNAQKTYTMTDIRNQVPYQQKFEYPFEMRVFSIGLDYVLHIRDTIEKSDVLIQTQAKSLVDKYMRDYQTKYELLKSKLEMIYNNR